MERVNQEIKRYLRKFVRHNQNDWTKLLVLTEYVYNTRTREKQDFTPYQLVYEETPKITTKKEMIRVHNKIIGQKQVTRKETRGQTVPKYKKEN